jgi:hypothetical protein
MGANLGKYGCFPLTRSEIDVVVERVQRWLPGWSAAPVFYVDQGLLREGGVDVERDLPRGIEIWLNTVASHGVRVVLIDTVEKASGRYLIKKSSRDPHGYLDWRHIQRVEKHAKQLNIRVLWAGGFGLHEAFELGKLGVFGIYVTSAVATKVPVSGGYVSDPTLPHVKMPTKDAVLRMKVLVEAGFLASKLQDGVGPDIKRTAASLFSALDDSDGGRIKILTGTLLAQCEQGWRSYWRTKPRGTP